MNCVECFVELLITERKIPTEKWHNTHDNIGHDNVSHRKTLKQENIRNRNKTNIGGQPLKILSRSSTEANVQ